MDFLEYQEDLESVVPGVAEAYKALLAGRGIGIYTSNGAYYNHTFFGRDASMSAKFVSDFDHQTARQVIDGLAALQGEMNDATTQQEPGRIHHELRDFRNWRGTSFDRYGLSWASRFWGIKDKRLFTYFALDTTATYIRLVHKYAFRIDKSILDHSVTTQSGKSVSVAESVEQAAGWILRQVDSDGRFMQRRSNRFSLPYQTFQDSLTAYFWADVVPVNFKLPVSYVETQAFAIDALDDAAQMLDQHVHRQLWQETARKMRTALFHEHWSESQQFFASALSWRGGVLRPLDVPNITAGWTLNTSFWQDIPEHDRAQKISAIVRRLFSEEFLTDVGLRTRSKYAAKPLGETIDYHGAQTVWPMFTFMVIEGLRRHRLYDLAKQLEVRLINGCNAAGNFAEFFIVDNTGRMNLPGGDKHSPARDAQMIPETNIAFTVVPMMVLAYRHTRPGANDEPSDWQAELERDVLASIPDCKLISPRDAKAQLDPQMIRLRRFLAGVRSALYIRKAGRR